MTNKFKKSIFTVFILICSQNSRAGEHDALVWTMLLGGGITAMNVAGAGMMGSDLEDWKDSQTHQSTQLSEGCGINVELTLKSNNASNFLWLALHNLGNDSKYIDSKNIRIRFDNGISRMVGLSYPMPPYKLEAKSSAAGFFPFPTKDDFKGAKSLKVSIPVKNKPDAENCEIQVLFVRNPAAPVNLNTTESVTSFEMELGSGGVLVKSDNIDRIGTLTSSIIFSMRGYGSFHHGFFLNLIGLFYDLNRSTFAPLGIDNSTYQMTYTLGYSYRFNPSNRFQISADLGLAFSEWTLKINGDKNYVSNFTLLDQVNLKYSLSRVREGKWKGDYYVGTSLFHLWMPNSSINGIRSDGHRVGAFLYLGAGF